jgi:hypothetical protein
MASMFRSQAGRVKRLLKGVDREAKKLIAMAEENSGMVMV